MNALTYAFRQLLRRPGFSFFAVLTLALGIGANTAIFSVLHAVVIRPFSYPESDRILFLTVRDRTDERNVGSFSYPDLRDYRVQADVFEQFGGAMDASLVVTGLDTPARVKGCYLSPEVFRLLRTPPLMGRVLAEEENRRGQERVVVLNHAAWRRFFNEAPDVVGRLMELDGRRHTVVGVMPSGFKFWDAQVYLPLVGGVPPEIEETRAAQVGVWGVARLKAGVTLEAANTALDAIAQRLGAAYPDTNRSSVPRAQSLASTVSAQIRPTLMLLFGAVGFVLLIACVNVTNLLLARGATRERELAVRAALGASPRQIFRQLLVETLPLACLGAMFGVAMAAGGLEIILAALPRNMIPAEANVRLSLPVLGFTAGVSLIAAVLAGLLPAFHASRAALNDGLKSGLRGTSEGRAGRVTRVLVLGEVALALTLLVGAGLLIRDLGRVVRIDTGFRTEGLLVTRLDLPEARYADPERAAVFVRGLVDRARAIPGVRDVGVARSAPFSGGTFNLPLIVFGRSYGSLEELRSTTCNPVMGDPIRALGIRLVAGRMLTDEDRAGGERVVVLNEAAAKRFFPEGNALGARVALGLPAHLAADGNVPPELIDPPWSTVVGLVSDTRQFGYLADPQPEVYLPYDQSFTFGGLRSQLHILLRTEGSPEAAVTGLRKELRDVDPLLPTDSIQTMRSMVADSLRPQRFVALLLGVFAGVAALLAAIGIYSVVAWSVAQRTREVGIRLALGATPGGVIARLVGQGLRPVAWGIGVGLVMALGLAQLMNQQLAQVPSRDPLTYGMVALFLAVVAAIACWLPARRAAQVDPMIALRSD